MIPYERRKRMLEELNKKEIVDLDELVAALKTVSQSTVRRDLKILSDEGQVILLRGGGVKLKRGSSDTPVNSRSIINVKEKDAIARCAAELVRDGEVIYIDSGSTTLHMIKYLRTKRITVVTTNTILLNELEGCRWNVLFWADRSTRPRPPSSAPSRTTCFAKMHFDESLYRRFGL